MRQRRPLGATYSGLVVLGLAGGVGLGLFSFGIFAWPKLFVPIAELLISLLLRRAGNLGFLTEHYKLFAGLVGFMAVMWVALVLRAILRKPEEDRQLDAALMTRYNSMARGAPVESVDPSQR